MKLAVVFPGQGSQYVGMGAGWLEHKQVQAVYDRADRALGMDLSRLCLEGPEEKLRLTEFTQPAILATSYAVYELLRDRLPEPAYFAGHSLGEFTALVATGSLEFEEAVRLVRERGRLMQQAVPEGEGSMAAIIGGDEGNLPADLIASEADLLKDFTAGYDDFASNMIELIHAQDAKESGASGGGTADLLSGIQAHEVAEVISSLRSEGRTGLNIANFNSPEQFVISGSAAEVDRALAEFEKLGVKRALKLPVSAPFHSSLMRPAADGLEPMLRRTRFKPNTVPVIANLTVQPYPPEPAEFRKILQLHITSPVKWTETVRYFAAHGVTHLLEVGPGKVLRMLVMKTTKAIKANNIDTPADLEKLEPWLNQENP